MNKLITYKIYWNEITTSSKILTIKEMEKKTTERGILPSHVVALSVTQAAQKLSKLKLKHYNVRSLCEANNITNILL